MYPLAKYVHCLLLLLGFFSAWSAWAMDLVLPRLDVNATQRAAGAVIIRDAANLGALQFGIAFDPAVVRIVSVDAGELLPNAMVEFNIAESVCSVALVSADPVSGSGNLVHVTVEAIGSSGAHSTLTVREPQAWDGASNAPLAVTAQDGAVTIAGGGSSAGLVLVLAVILVLLLAMMLWLYFRQRKVAAVPGGVPVNTAPLSHDGPNFCSHCGTRVASNMNFCAQCGKGLKHSAVPPAPTGNPL